MKIEEKLFFARFYTKCMYNLVVHMNVKIFWCWWRLPIEERACRKTDLGGGDYYLRNSGLPPSGDRMAGGLVTSLRLGDQFCGAWR